MTESVQEVDGEELSYDVVIVGAGPAGLAAAIKIKQENVELTVVVIEKGATVGAHILSGAAIDPTPLDELLPSWRTDPDCPLKTAVTADRFLFLTKRSGIRIPHAFLPKMLSNRHSFVGSLGDLCIWMAGRAEALGVEIYAGFSAAGLLLDEQGTTRGILTRALGMDRDGRPGPQYQPPIAIHGKYVLLAEGARGSLTQDALLRYQLGADSDPQKFGLGLKEIWRIPVERHQSGLVQHGLGWPLGNAVGGGSFIYHYGADKLAVGLVVHLDYANPHLSPYQEFQRLKTHPWIRSMLEGGERLSYGARVISGGGWQSVPQLVFPGGALIGCAAGFVNVPRIKGVHNAFASGMLVASSVVKAIGEGRSNDVLECYQQRWRESSLGKDLFPARNIKPLWSRFGTLAGTAIGGLELWIGAFTKGWSAFGTLHHQSADWRKLAPAKAYKKIHYSRPDGIITTDRMTSVSFANVSQVEDQPCHLNVRDVELQRNSELDLFGGPSALYCPAGVYEWQETAKGPRYQINSQNCIHCKACDIKDPNQNIQWSPPQGGDGPCYSGM